MRLRTKGNYGGLEHVSESEAEEAIQAVRRIFQAVHEAHPDVFSDPEGIL
jgi:HEPN domain-containing protein